MTIHDLGMTCANEYDVYGNVRNRLGTASTAHGFVGALGHLSDTSTNLIYMRARYYDPGTGRFVNQDPSANGNNWFVYCDDNPINEQDANGKTGKALAWALSAVANDDAFDWGLTFTIESVLGAISAKDSTGLAITGITAGILAVTCFAVALGANAPEAVAAAIGGGLLPVITSMIIGAQQGESLAAAAGGIASTAVCAYAGYGLMVAGALALDDCD